MTVYITSIDICRAMNLGRNVAYFYNEDIGKFYYYKDHPMKPRRIAMTHSLLESFDVYRKMDVYSSRKCSR
jgi:histone deacetylase 1/2